MENKISDNSFLDYAIYSTSDKDFPSNRCKGGNLKSVLVVYVQETGQQLDFLTKILKAVHFDVEKDISLLALTPQENISFSKVFQNEKYKIIILFGVDPVKAGLHFNFPVYKEVNHLGIRFFRADNLIAIATDKQLKGALWNCLKDSFL